MIDNQLTQTGRGGLPHAMFLALTSPRQMTATEEVIAGITLILIGVALFLFRKRFITFQLLAVQELKPIKGHLTTVRRLLEIAWPVFSIALILIGLTWLLPFV